MTDIFFATGSGQLGRSLHKRKIPTRKRVPEFSKEVLDSFALSGDANHKDPRGV